MFFFAGSPGRREARAGAAGEGVRNLEGLGLTQRYGSTKAKAGVLSVVALVAILMPMWLLLLLWIRHEHALVEQAARNDAMNLATAFSGHVRSVIQYADTLILDLRDDAAHNNPRGFEDFAKRKFSVYGDLVALFGMIDARGRLVYTDHGPVEEPVDLSDREHFRIHRDNPGQDRLYISKPVLGRVSGIWAIQVTRPVFDQGRFAGVFSLSVPVSYFTDFYKQINVGDAGLIALVGLDRAPRAIASGNPLPRKETTLLPADRPYFDRARPDQGFYTGMNVLNDQQSLVAYRRLNDLGLVVLVQLAPADYLAAFKDREQLLVLSAGVVSALLLAVALLGFYAARRHLDNTAALKAAHEKLRQLVSIDLLTGAQSRRAFLEVLDAELMRAHRHRQPLAFLMLDIDHFKRVNDTYGHPVGDVVLKEFVAICRGALRAHDVLGRLGGEEFAALLPHTDADGAVRVAEKLRLAVAEATIATAKGDLRIITSVGVATALPAGDDPEHLLGRADEALYAAKHSGRNRVSVTPAGSVEYV